MCRYPQATYMEPIASQRTKEWQYIQDDAHLNYRHRKHAKNAAVTAGIIYIEKWWCVTPQNPNSGKVHSTTLGGIYKTLATKVIPRPEGAILYCRTIHSHQQERFGYHMNRQSSHHRGLFRMTNKCSFLKQARPPKSLHMWPTHVGLHPQVSWTVF